MTTLPRMYAPITIGGVRGGTPLTLDRAVDLLERLADASDRAGDAYDRALERYESAKRKDTKARRLQDVKRAQRAMKRADDATARLENQIDEYTAALAKAEEPEETADEWQFGLSYEAAARGGHNVDLNIDIRRADGFPMTLGEARDALRVRLTTGAFPDGVEAASIMYRSPDARSVRGSTFRTGGHDVETLDESFTAVIESTRLSDWRVGGIEA